MASANCRFEDFIKINQADKELLIGMYDGFVGPSGKIFQEFYQSKDPRNLIKLAGQILDDTKKLVEDAGYEVKTLKYTLPNKKHIWCFQIKCKKFSFNEKLDDPYDYF